MERNTVPTWKVLAALGTAAISACSPREHERTFPQPQSTQCHPRDTQKFYDLVQGFSNCIADVTHIDRPFSNPYKNIQGHSCRIMDGEEFKESSVSIGPDELYVSQTTGRTVPIGEKSTSMVSERYDGIAVAPKTQILKQERQSPQLITCQVTNDEIAKMRETIDHALELLKDARALRLLQSPEATSQ